MATKRPRPASPVLQYRSQQTTDSDDEDIENDDLQATTPRPHAHATLSHPTISPPPMKSHRVNPQASRQLLCTLPPSCNSRPTQLASSQELESHYSKYHAFVCEVNGCGCVFPEGRFLDLHFTENHDPIAALRQERGEKIFSCLVTSCGRFFSTPKTRRQHLIAAHGYPSEYFFAVTNKGVGGLLKKWGEGASMMRAPWKPRNTEERRMSVDSKKTEEDEESSGAAEEMEEDTTEGGKSEDDEHHDAGMDGLQEAMGSLALIPPAIRFGRGGKAAGFSGSIKHTKVEKTLEGGNKTKADAREEKKPQPKKKALKVKTTEETASDKTPKVDVKIAVIDEDKMDEDLQRVNSGDGLQQEINGHAGITRGRGRGRGSSRGLAPAVRGAGPSQAIASAALHKGGISGRGRGGMASRGVFGPKAGAGIAGPAIPGVPGMVPMSVLMRARGRGIGRGRGRGIAMRGRGQ